MPKTTAAEIEEKIIGFLQRHRKEGALYTSDISHGTRETTPRIRRILLSMEARKIVRRVVIGNPTTWILTDPPPAAQG